MINHRSDTTTRLYYNIYNKYRTGRSAHTTEYSWQFAMTKWSWDMEVKQRDDETRKSQLLMRSWVAVIPEAKSIGLNGNSTRSHRRGDTTWSDGDDNDHDGRRRGRHVGPSPYRANTRSGKPRSGGLGRRPDVLKRPLDTRKRDDHQI